jgi:DNA-binding MarR family transcriptional regulator
VTDAAPTIEELTQGWSGTSIPVPYVNATTGIIRACNVLSQVQREVLAELDLSIRPFVVISTLARGADHTLSISELRRLTFIHAATLTSTLAKLEERGLVERTMSTTDRRSITVVLTAAGLELVDEGYRRLSTIKFGLAGLSEEQAAQLAELTSLIDLTAEPTG